MVTTTRQKRVTLYCTEGGSDKQYTLWIELQDDAFVVNFTYGPRGGWVQTGTKTLAPVPIEKAEQIYARLLASKQAKGYHIGEGAPSFSNTEGAIDSGLRVMLLTPVPEEELDRFITDDAWGAQEKINGVHCALIVADGTVTGVNKRGLQMSIPEKVAEAFAHLIDRHELDGELVGCTYYLFDVIQQSLPAGERYVVASRLVASGFPRKVVMLVPMATGKTAKRALARRLKKGNREGIVFKRLDAPYTPGRIHSPAEAVAVKIKFYAEGDFVVLGWNAGKQSIRLGAYNDGASRLADVGRLTIPDKYVAQVRTGAVVRVRYLYATKAKKLYQPTLQPTDDELVIRKDVAPTDCLVSQLKFAGNAT